jgi:phosphatidylserine/phosphatidylglycerophosphate/cardiolipin synthase-like enzyme
MANRVAPWILDVGPAAGPVWPASTSVNHPAAGTTGSSIVQHCSGPTAFSLVLTMDDAELVGGVLFDTPDPDASARALVTLLLAERFDASLARQFGLEPVLVDSLRHRLRRDPGSVQLACATGAAWVRGARAISRTGTWEVVASLPASLDLPPGLRRTTAETLITLVAGSERDLRIAAPYIDESGLGFLGDVIVAASQRDVNIEVFEPRTSESARLAISGLETRVRAAGNIRRFRRVRPVYDAPFAHLKVVVADAAAAYIGSANLTDAALASRNLELGVLVRGREVAVINALLDLYREL